MSLDATLEEILDNVKKHSKQRAFDYEYTQEKFRKNHDTLEEYALIDPYNLGENIKHGDIIRYEKKKLDNHFRECVEQIADNIHVNIKTKDKQNIYASAENIKAAAQIVKTSKNLKKKKW